MAGPTEFSEESVRQFMLANGGRVTNHELVKHFKSWLTHPTEKDLARQKFKEYVNRLATMKIEEGEKYLMLKKRYYPNFEDDDVPQLSSRRPSGDPPSAPMAAPPPPPSRRGLPSQSSSPSLLDEVMANYQPLAASIALSSTSSGYSGHGARRQLPPTPNGPPYQQPPVQPPQSYSTPQPFSNSPAGSQRSSYVSAPSQAPIRAPPPYRGPPPQAPQQQPPYRPPPPPAVQQVSRGPPHSADLGLPMHSDYGLPPMRQGVFHPPNPGYGVPSSAILDSPRNSPNSLNNISQLGLNGLPPPLLPKKNGTSGSLSSLSRSSSIMSVQSSNPRVLEGTPSGSPAMQSRSVSLTGPPPIPPLPSRDSYAGSQSSLSSSTGHGNVSRQTSNEDKENSNPPTSGDDQIKELPNKNEKISVKERTKTFNRLASEGDLLTVPMKNSSQNSSQVKRRNSRAVDRRGSSVARDKDDDSSSISTLDQTAKQWMVQAAKGDYHQMVKMLREDQRLAKHKDFVSGFTALHWAAKHGNLDMVKLLAGNYSAPVNVKSHGGYTPLHLACQFGHQEVFSFMVKAYGADPHIRDNAGKKPRQYMMAHDQASGPLSLSSDTFRQLKDRRRNRTRQNNDKNSGILRFGSLSVKVKKTTEAFNNYFGARSTSSDSISLPYMSTGSMSSINSFGSRDDSMKMPPPKFAPIKKRKSKRPVDYVKSAPVTPTETSPIKEERSDSDSEYGFNSQWSTTPKS